MFEGHLNVLYTQGCSIRRCIVSKVTTTVTLFYCHSSFHHSLAMDSIDAHVYTRKQENKNFLEAGEF